MNDERLDHLIDAHLSGAMDDDERRELDARLLHSAGDRERFWQLSETHVLLHEGIQRRVVGSPSKPVRPSFLPPIGWLTAAAALAFGCFLAWHHVVPKANTSQPVATLAAANDAVWADPNVELTLRGGELPPGLLRLESGTAEFLCADGATVVMRGPAAVRFPARKHVFVEAGRIFCRCPSPESRLSIETPATEVVDLGTEFAVEARADRSTLVAVLSGEVQVGKTQPRRLHKGEAAEVRSDGILIIKPLVREEFSGLLLASPPAGDAALRGGNLLRDPGFENGLSAQTWTGTEPNLRPEPRGGRSGAAVRVSAGGFAQWPLCRQKIETGDISGRLVVASVWAATPGDDRMRDGQFAMLKVAFLNEQGREFAFSKRHILAGKPSPGRFEQVQFAAFVPQGTRSVLLQLVFCTRASDAGSVIFDDASLTLSEPPSAN